MKKLICIFLFLFPVVAIAQQPLYKDSPVDYAWKYVGNEGFTAGEAAFTNLAFSLSGQPYIAFMDGTNSKKLSVMMFDGNNWGYAGNAGISSGVTDEISLAISPSDNKPYVAYRANGEGGVVVKFDGTTWAKVGQGLGEAGCVSLAFSPSGEPYVACSYYVTGLSGNAKVMKFIGTEWVNVGIAGFSAGKVQYISLAFSPSGQPYVAYMDEGNSSKSTVMKFDGTNWLNVGNAGFSSDTVQYTSLAFSPLGEPYVAFQDWGNSKKTTVMMFNGATWVNVGNSGFSIGEADYTSLSFSPTNGQPYVAFKDFGNSRKATVMKYNGTNWVNVGNNGFSPGIVYFTSLAFSPTDNKPYVAFEDVASGFTASVMKYDSVMVGINEPRQSKFLLYPDPATDKITIEFAEDQAPCQLSMMNLNGEEVLTSNLIKTKTHLDISNLSNGVYFVRLTGGKSVEVGKFVKQ
ncbi:MAG: T9SS type A sorting domain-containing protein [Bacteroidota bacterium]